MLEPSELFPEVPNLYEFPSVHADMLFDDERVGRYSEAIKQVVRKGDVVADIGTGTGLLAFLCLQAGAERVHAIERSPALRWAKLLAEHHGYSEKIVFHGKDSRATNLSEKVDVIVSELIGHIAFEEGMVESLFDARERFLSEHGTIIPQQVKLRVALVSEQDIYPTYINCWKSVKGIDYTIMREEAVKACYLTSINDRNLLSEPATFFFVDFLNDNKPGDLCDVRCFRVCRAGDINGVALWFDAELACGINLSSGPWNRQTHWLQCFAPIRHPFTVNKGDVLRVTIDMILRKTEEDSFHFSVNINKE